jgi:crotonobetainyl-CoA:carnitine CoA-transferase CaiB-like acyl-CoA transferase
MYTVLDLTRLYPGGVATRLLTDLGFNVIKVEDTGAGDYVRETLPRLHEVLNAGKRSISINLKSSEGREVFYRLVGRAHVVVESFRPGVAARLGVDYGSLSRINPRIVYCSINGYGEGGPYSNLPGHDLNYAGIAGLLARESMEEPRPLTAQVADVGSALLAVVGILNLLLRGTGGRVEVSMTEAALLFNTLNMAEYLSGREPSLTGRYPFYNVYRCRDGYVTLGAIEPRFWGNLCRAVGREDLLSSQLDPRAMVELSREFDKYSRAELLRKLWENDVPAAPVNSLRETLEDPQLRARGITVETMASPLVINASRAHRGGPAPRRGEHTVELLRELGYSEEEMMKLRDRGAVYWD